MKRLWVDANVLLRFLTREPVLAPLMNADGVEVEDRDLLIQAVELSGEKNVDFVDAVLALQAARRDEPVCSFDRDFKRLPVHWIVPS